MRKPGEWISCASGTSFWPFDPRAEDVDFGEIAHSLSMKCRWGGHCSSFYSVAQHSLLVLTAARRYEPDDLDLHLAALLHDAPEAYIGDTVRPVKYADCMAGLRAAEELIWAAIATAAGIPVELIDHPIIKRADEAVLTLEARALMHPDRVAEMGLHVEPPERLSIHPQPPGGQIRAAFLSTYQVLQAERKRRRRAVVA